MNALTVLFAAHAAPQAFQPVFSGNSAFGLALEGARRFPGTKKLVLLGKEGADYPGLGDAECVSRPEWTVKEFLSELSRLSGAFDLCYVAWADCPLLDAALAEAIGERHLRYGAEYSYADGWPYGFAPELLSPGTPGILAKILDQAGEDGGPVERDSIFTVIRRDINAFDIETEISPVDLRQYRLNLAADSRRNLLLLRGLMAAGLRDAAGAAELIAGKPELLRSLPNFFAIQVSALCPQSCSLCPWPAYREGGGGNRPAGGKGGGRASGEGPFMGEEAFGRLLDRIGAFTEDGVIDLSLWGELALHPGKTALVRGVLERPGLSLIIETSGLGWKREELETLAEEARRAPGRLNRMAPLSWIISLDAQDPARYRELRGPGYGEAAECAKTLFGLFPGDSYVQAIRVRGFEDDIEQFYRHWQGIAPGTEHIIIQKYDHFCGALPRLAASDLSPVLRRPCWHLLRDMNILLDGTVPCCREDLGCLAGKAARPVLGNAFTEDLETLWAGGGALYLEQTRQEYRSICGDCDEYYTYNY
jgi:spiro-SPASM protein